MQILLLRVYAKIQKYFHMGRMRTLVETSICKLFIFYPVAIKEKQQILDDSVVKFWWHR